MNELKKNYSYRCDAIITDCYIVMPAGVTDKEGNRRYCKIDNAMWDTGATNTIISPEVVDALGLKSTGQSSVSAYGSVVDTWTYKIDLCFDNGYKIQNLEVMSGVYGDYDVLIGMDVITQKVSFPFQPSKARLPFHSVCRPENQQLID